MIFLAFAIDLRLFTEEVGDYAKQYVKDADKGLCEDMKSRGRLVSKDSIKHRCSIYSKLEVGTLKLLQ